MRALLVENERGIARFIEQGLAQAGYAVDVAEDGRTGLDYALAAHYDVIIMDVMLPIMDGFRLLQEFRSKKLKTPILLLSARDGIDDRVKGLDLGADDYLVKPFAFSELLARLRALLRRPSLQVGTVLQVGELELDTAYHTVCWQGQEIQLSAREFSLLEYLMRHPGQVLTRMQIAEHVWNFRNTGDTKVIDVYIGYLRRKLKQGFASQPIQTVRGVGYRLSQQKEKI